VSTPGVLTLAITAMLVLASACSAGSADVSEQVLPAAVASAVPNPTVVPSPTPDPTATAVPPTVTPVPVPTATPTPAPTPQPEGPCDAGPLALPNPDRPIYTGSIAIDPVTGSVTGRLEIAFTPDLDIDALYLRLWPNGPRPASGGVVLELLDVSVDGRRVTPDLLAPTTALLSLASPVSADQTVSVTTQFTLVVPTELRSRLSGRDDYMRLGTILPILPWEPGRGWALDPATSLFAEAVSSPVADYNIEVSVPDGFGVLASGVVDEEGVWRVQAARDFALSVGRFRTVTGMAMAPEPVQITVGVHDTIDDDPNVYLVKIIDSLEQFSQRWGQYPWPSLTFAITPNLRGGIEFPTHIMQGPDTFGRVTSHEVGHMFFYSLVGNNQGAEPWLDEGITSYAEFTYEGTPANAYEIPADGIGNATEPMTFWEDRSASYYRSVYSQTGFALQRLGEQADVDCALARYVAANAHRIATADDFVAAFEPTFPDIINQLAALGVVIELPQ